MPNEVPVACSLGGSEATVRATELAAVGRSVLIGPEFDGATATMSFAPAAREELESVVAAESQCCPFFDFELSEDAHAVTLRVSAPEHAAQAVTDFVAALTADRSDR